MTDYRLFNLEKKRALVVGGSGVLGFAMAKGLAQAGAEVVITSRSLDKAQKRSSEAEEEGLKLYPIAFDASKVEDAREGVRNGEELAGGPFQILVNCAGGNQPGATAIPGDRNFFDLDIDAIREVVDLNLMAGCLIPAQVIGQRLAEGNLQGSIINISSVSADLPLTRVIGYSAAKAAVENATKWLAVHFSKELKIDVRVNAIMPGFFLTEQNRFLLTNEDGTRTDRGDLIVTNTPLGEFGKPEDLCGAVLYLASDESRFVTGSVISVDGGFTAFGGV